MRSRRRGAALRSTAGGLVALLLFVAVACSGSDETDGTDPPTPDITPTTEAPRPDDGVLKIGVLAPRSGPGAAIGQSIGEAATRAIGMINIAGGIGGQRVELVPEDEGTTELTAREAIDALLAEGVDAVVGPTSSLVERSRRARRSIWGHGANRGHHRARHGSDPGAR